MFKKLEEAVKKDKIKIYSENEKFWMEIRDKAKLGMENLPLELEGIKKQIRLNEEIFKLAEKNLKNGK